MPKQTKSNGRSSGAKLPSAAAVKRKKKSIIPTLILALIVLAAIATVYLLDTAGIINVFGNKPAKPEPYTVSGGTMELHMIDVGQGDSLLVAVPDGYMLVDAGPNDKESEDAIKNYLDALGVTKLEYFVITHPDADHIGGADMVLETYSVGTVLMETYTYKTETGVYKDMMTALEKNGAEFKDPSPDDKYTIGDLHITVLGPIETYSEDKNNNSIVMRMDFGSTSFMMTGDAESKSEKAILEKYGNDMLDCDVLKVGHHGADTSTTEKFLSAVSPDIALISCGINNKFGHPKATTVDKLTNAKAEIYRTDILGDVVLVSDGTKVAVKESGK